ncbi:MAG: MptD family putative ECF transporter S component [Eggerthellaceae bacterium]
MKNQPEDSDSRIGILELPQKYRSVYVIYSMHMIVFVLVLGSDGLATFVESISLEQAQQMVAMYTVDMMVICVLINIVTELLAGRFGMFINDKFFEKGAKESRLG